MPGTLQRPRHAGPLLAGKASPGADTPTSAVPSLETRSRRGEEAKVGASSPCRYKAP